MHGCLAFYLGAVDSNLGPQAFKARALISETSPQSTFSSLCFIHINYSLSLRVVLPESTSESQPPGTDDNIGF